MKLDAHTYNIIMFEMRRYDIKSTNVTVSVEERRLLVAVAGLHCTVYSRSLSSSIRSWSPEVAMLCMNIHSYF